MFLYGKQASVTIAKKRLQELLTSDRMHCTPDMTAQLREDLYSTISKYIPIHADDFELKLSRSDIHIKYTGEDK